MLPMLRNRTLFPSLADEFYGKDWIPGFVNEQTGLSIPAVNILEGKDDFKIEVAIPGLKKEDFKLKVENDVLTISSEKENQKEEKNGKFMRKEFCYSSFSRSFVLSDGVDPDKISASYKDGVLNVIIPKKESVKEKPVRQINIS